MALEDMDPVIVRRVAIHEAGHAVVAEAVGLRVSSIKWKQGENPATHWGRYAYSRWGRDAGFAEIATWLGGYVATRRASRGHREADLCGAWHDFAQIENWCHTNHRMPGFERITARRASVRHSLRIAHCVVRANWAHLKRLARMIEKLAARGAVNLDEDDLRPYLEHVRRWDGPLAPSSVADGVSTPH